eukprot:gb/GFBE01023058.1/.p1 GENE.gb/GFBE01023058.1/~~gb/GFBE01023058.1/.p1  ORF type:complete len:893 (+),score=180.88 gb/GFBE01023058.1/:1-2679(+)
MAAGMHAAALGQLGPSRSMRTAVTADVAGLDAAEPVEIALMTERRSHQAAYILQERTRSSRPLGGRAGRMLACQERSGQPAPGGESTPGGGAEDKSMVKPPASRAPLQEARAWLVRTLFQLVPFLNWVRQLSWKSVRADVIAGLTVGVMVIPQSMSYANIAGLPYKYGMYSACLPTFIYAFFGQSRQLAVGPVAMVSLLIDAGLEDQLDASNCPGWDPSSGKHQRDVCMDEYVKLAVLTAAVMGLMQIVAMALRMGFLVSFLGHPVTSGFTSGAAIIIGLSQLKHLLGVDLMKSQFIYVTIGSIVQSISHTKLMTFLLGLVSLVFLICAKKVSQRWKRLSLFGPMAPLICCAVGTLLLWLCQPLRDDFHVKFVGEIPQGIFPESVSLWNFRDIPKVLPTALSACLIGYMESIAIGKNLAAKHGYELEAGQELFALGLSNLVGAMFSCYPVTGSFSRSAVNNATGAVSQLSGLVTSVVMLCTLLWLTPVFYYLPNFVLAAIVISSVAPLVAYGEAIKLWHVKKQDFVLWVAAFVGTLFLGVLVGIALAVGLSLVIVIYESVRPQIMILWRIPGTTIYRNVKQESSGAFVPNVFIARIGSSMYFANASFIKDMLLGYVEDLEQINSTEYIVLEMSPVVSVDSTALHVLEDVVTDFRGRGIQIAFAMVGNRLERTFARAGLKTFVGERWFFPTVHDAVVGCLRHQQAKRKLLACVSKRTITALPPTDSEGLSSDASGSGAAAAADERQLDVEQGRPRMLTQSQEDMLEVEDNPVNPGNEIGVSNDLHHGCTVVFINLVEDVPMIMSDITAVFQRRLLTVCRAHIEAMGNDGFSNQNLHAASLANHVYHVQSLNSGGKLEESELRALKAELEELLDRHLGMEPATAAAPATMVAHL